MIRDHCIDYEEKPTLKVVDKIFESLLSPAHKGYFDYWRQRLHDELGSPDDGHATLLLNAVSKDPEGLPISMMKQILGKKISDQDEKDEKLRYLLDVLQSDGYLIEINNRYHFRSSLIRDYWYRRMIG